MKARKVIFILVFIALCFIGMGIYLVNNSLDESDGVSEVKVTTEVSDTVLDKVKKLNKKNADVIGWIKLVNSKINYPVLYSGDDFYLNYNYKKEYSKEGSIFIDKYNSLDDINLIIHGHNMNNGHMFHDLISYKEKSYYEDHKFIDFYTLDEHKRYEVIAVFLSKVYKKTDDVFKYYKFYGDISISEYSEYIKNIKKLSLYEIDSSSKYPTKLISLSTCEYSNENGRLVVVAKEV